MTDEERDRKNLLTDTLWTDCASRRLEALGFQIESTLQLARLFMEAAYESHQGDVTEISRTNRVLGHLHMAAYEFTRMSDTVGSEFDNFLHETDFTPEELAAAAIPTVPPLPEPEPESEPEVKSEPDPK